MSVRKGDRCEGKLQVLNKARELKRYSLAALKNEKHLPKSTRWLYASPPTREQLYAKWVKRNKASNAASSKRYTLKSKAATMHQGRRTSPSFLGLQTLPVEIPTTCGAK